MKNPNRIHVTTAEKALKTVYDDASEKGIEHALSDLRHLCDARRDFGILNWPSSAV